MFVIIFLSSFCQLLSPRFIARIGRVRPDHKSSDQPDQKAALSNVVSLGIPNYCQLWPEGASALLCLQ